jgi:hypothetical protein
MPPEGLLDPVSFTTTRMATMTTTTPTTTQLVREEPCRCVRW